MGVKRKHIVVSFDKGKHLLFPYDDGPVLPVKVIIADIDMDMLYTETGGASVKADIDTKAELSEVAITPELFARIMHAVAKFVTEANQS